MLKIYWDESNKISHGYIIPYVEITKDGQRRLWKLKITFYFLIIPFSTHVYIPSSWFNFPLNLSAFFLRFLFGIGNKGQRPISHHHQHIGHASSFIAILHELIIVCSSVAYYSWEMFVGCGQVLGGGVGVYVRVTRVNWDIRRGMFWMTTGGQIEIVGF